MYIVYIVKTVHYVTPTVITRLRNIANNEAFKGVFLYLIKNLLSRTTNLVFFKNNRVNAIVGVGL